MKNNGKNGSLNPTWTGAIVLALEDGFRLHRLIDPETTPADSFLRAIGDLQREHGNFIGLTKGAQSAAPAVLHLVQLARDRANFARRRHPDRQRGQSADADTDRKGQRITPGKVVQNAGDPGARGASGEGREHHGAENAAVMLALKYLHHHRPHDGGQAVAERALRQHHDVDQRQGRKLRQRDQRRKADRKAEAARGPDPFAPDPVGEMSEQRSGRECRAG